MEKQKESVIFHRYILKNFVILIRGDKEFQNELNSVIFSYLSEEDRNGCTSLDSLIKFKESALNDQLSSLRLVLSKLNTEIEDLEFQSTSRC